MDNEDERKRLMNEKIVIVHQKENRKSFIKNLPSDLAEKFIECSYITYPSDQAIIEDIFNIIKSIQQNGQIGKTYYEVINNCYKEVSWEKQVESLVKSLIFNCTSKAAYFWNMEREAPIFILDFNFARSIILQIWKLIKYDRLLVVTEDFKEGIVIDHYGGYLLEDPNPQEIVYEVTAWGYCGEERSFV